MQISTDGYGVRIHHVSRRSRSQPVSLHELIYPPQSPLSAPLSPGRPGTGAAAYNRTHTQRSMSKDVHTHTHTGTVAEYSIPSHTEQNTTHQIDGRH